MTYFSQYGTIECAYLIFDKNSRNSRCFGFVEYSDKNVAEHVNTIKNHTIDGKVVITKFQVLKVGKSSKNSDEEDTTSTSDHQNHQNLSENPVYTDLNQNLSSNPQQNEYYQSPVYTQDSLDYTYQEMAQPQQQYIYQNNEDYYYAQPGEQMYYYQQDYTQNYNVADSQNMQYSQIEEPIYYLDENNCYYDQNGYYQGQAQGNQMQAQAEGQYVDYGNYQNYDNGVQTSYDVKDIEANMMQQAGPQFYN